MKPGAFRAAALMLFLTALNAGAQEHDFPVLTGPYLGQKPPANDPVLFAPGIVSTDAGNMSSVTINPDGKEIYWDVNDRIWFTKLENGRWTKPEILPFCKKDSHLYRVPFVVPSGKRMFFISTRPGAVSQDKENIWYAERTSSGWSDPTPVSAEVNALRLHWSISVSDSGTLYFQGSGEDSREGSADIYCSRLMNGAYTKPVNMGPQVNSPATETCPYIAPDESYIVFNRFDQTDPKNTGIFICHRDKSGKWLPAVMALGGSKDKGGLSPRISPDGKYLFFVRGTDGMWWMPAGFLRRLNAGK